jgi:hypothetical protein
MCLFLDLPIDVPISMEGKKGILHPKLTGQVTSEPTWRMEEIGLIWIVQGLNWTFS